jgi:plastocyanin
VRTPDVVLEAPVPVLRTLARLTAPAALALPLLLAGCGGDDGSASTADAGTAHAGTTHAGTAHAGPTSTASTGTGSSTGSTPASTSASDTPATTLGATEADFSIELSSSTVAAGTYEITVVNEGSATHSLTIKGPGGVDQTSDTLQGGKSTTMTVTLQPGEYEVYCPIGNHRAMGMDTTLTVS